MVFAPSYISSQENDFIIIEMKKILFAVMVLASSTSVAEARYWYKYSDGGNASYEKYDYAYGIEDGQGGGGHYDVYNYGYGVTKNDTYYYKQDGYQPEYFNNSAQYYDAQIVPEYY